MAPLLDNYGYLALGGLILVEDFGVPAPGESILIAASVYAGAERLNIVVVGVIAVLAAIAGDNIGYAIGRYGGHALVLRFGKYVLLTRERLDKAERFFGRYGGQIVVVARFIEGLRQLNGIIAGIAEMPWPRFLVFNTIGAALWVGVWSTVGYLAGNNITSIYSTVTRYSLYVLIALAVLAAAWIIRTVVRRRRRTRGRGPMPDARATDSPPDAPATGSPPDAPPSDSPPDARPSDSPPDVRPTKEGDHA